MKVFTGQVKFEDTIQLHYWKSTLFFFLEVDPNKSTEVQSSKIFCGAERMNFE